MGTELIGRWSASGHGGPDAFGRKTEARELSENDRTQAQQRPIIHYAASGRNLTIEIGWLWLNAERHVDGIERPDAGRVRLVDLTRASSRPEICPVKG